jgi:hypothetical protein
MTAIKNPQFIISPEMLNKCAEFAQASIDTNANRYAHRNQFNVSKIKDDIRNGKVSEFGVYEVLSQALPDLTLPDCQVYAKKDKSWDPDLKSPSSEIRLAVKSQDINSEINYGRSWVFQYNQNKNYDCDTGIFGKKLDPNYYVCFVSLNVPKRTGELRAVVRVQWLHEKKLFKPMKKLNLQGNKLAVYYSDLEQHLEELWQL